MISFTDMPGALLKLLIKRVPYLFTLKSVLFISLFIGSIQVFITIFLEPHNTGDYQVTYRNLLLSGFALCFVFPFLLIYAVERFIYHLQGKTWIVYQEVLSKTLLIILISTASYFYNITVINSISPSFERWLEHIVVFGLPYIPLFIPFMIIIYAILYRIHSSDEPKVILKGQNQDDILEITESEFIYAESDQNYVTIYYKNGKNIDKRYMRSSLQAIEDQLDFSVRIHRSYLINPVYLKSIKGNKRKRVASLNLVDSELPVSVNFDNKSLLNGS